MKQKMFKKLGILLFVTTLGVQGVKAQVSDHDQTTLQIKLNPLISIEVNQANVLLEFTTLEDYQTGVTNAMANHLTISSLLPYTLNLKSDNATLAGTGDNTSTISAGVVKVELPDGGDLGGTYTPITSLNAEDQPLIVLGTPTLAKDINVTYSTAAESVGIIGNPADTYSSTITYTISSL